MIPCTTLDLALASAERVDAIKCDVEGAETRVLEGAIHTLERFKPLLLIEIEERHSQRYGQQAAQVFEVLAGLGYRRVRDFGDRNFLFAPPG